MTERDRKARVTGADVAKLAGVSAATVSYVLNDKARSSIPESTRQRVRLAAERLGYRPNPAARSLRVGRSDVVLALLPDVDIGVAFRCGLQELALALKLFGLSLVVHPTPLDSAGMRELWRSITPACVFAYGGLSPEDVEVMHAAGIQVAIGCSTAELRHPWELRIGGDGDVGRAQVDHLMARGHSRIGLALPAWLAETFLAEDRRAGMVDALRSEGEGRLSVRYFPSEPGEAGRELIGWLAEEPDLTAIAAWDDYVAARVCSAAAGVGLAVPARLAVIGAFDFAVSTIVQPALTSVRIDLVAAMQRVASAISAALAGHPLPDMPVCGDSAVVVTRRST